MTKFNDSTYKGIRKEETPISLQNYENKDSRKEFYYPYCQMRLSKLQGRSGENVSYNCGTCSIEYPEESEIKSKSHLSTPQRSNNQNPYVAYPPEPELKRKKTKIKDGLVSSYNYPEIILCNERITT